MVAAFRVCPAAEHVLIDFAIDRNPGLLRHVPEDVVLTSAPTFLQLRQIFPLFKRSSFVLPCRLQVVSPCRSSRPRTFG